MILSIDGKHYPQPSIADLSLRHTLALQRELVATNISSAKTWGDVRRLLAEMEALPAAERENHPEALFLTAITVWAARVLAGDEVGLLEAIDVPVTSLKWIAEPADRQAPGKAQPRRGANPKK